MINHLTGFLNKCVLAFKRDNLLETSSSVKKENSAAFGFCIFCVTINPYITAHKPMCIRYFHNPACCTSGRGIRKNNGYLENSATGEADAPDVLSRACFILPLPVRDHF